MDSKKVLSAILITVFLAGLASTAATSSSSSYVPSTSHVNLNMYVTEGGKKIGFATNPVIYINATKGQYSFQDTGNGLNVSLSYGTYIVTVMPTESVLSGTHYLTNKTQSYLDVNSQYQSMSIDLKGVVLSYSSVSLKGLNGETATVQFSTTGGYNFFTKTTNATKFNAYLPNGTMFYESSYFSNPSNGVSTQVLETSSTGSVTVDLAPGALNYFGYVKTKSGSSISSFSVVEYNTSDKAYTTVPFTSGVYSVSAQSGTVFWVAAKGYAPMAFSSSTTLKLAPSTSNVYTNYSLSKNLQDISVETHYALNSGTAFPGIGNSSAMSLSYQEQLDNATTSGFVNDVMNFANNTPVNTYYSLQANNSYYNLTNKNVDKKSFVYNKESLSLYAFANYTNSKMSSKDYKNLVLKVYQKGTQFTPSSVDHLTYVLYDNSNVSVKSATSGVTYGNPFEIMPVSTSSMVSVSFGKTQNPHFVNANAVVYYKGMLAASPVLNSSAKNAVVVVPYDQQFSINMSKTLYNPINGQYQYLSPVSFAWSNSSASLSGYNVSLTLKSTSTFNLKGTDSSGFSNTTNVTFLVLPKNNLPNVNFTYTFNGKAHKVSSAVADKGTVNITVSQNSQITFDASLSSLNVSYNSVNYSVPLDYNWMFPNSTLKGSTVNYQFTTPSINGVPKHATLNVTSAGNTKTSVSINAVVNDTTAPSALITVQSTSNKNITAIPAGSPVILTGNYTTDKYYSKSQLKYNWTFLYANGTKIALNDSSLSILAYNSSASSWNSSSWLKVQFNITAKVHISLKVQNPKLSGYDNVTYTTTYSGPKLLVSGVHYSGTFSQGVVKEVEVNVTNHGKTLVHSVSIMVYDNGVVIKDKLFSNKTLAANQTKTFDVNITLPNSGSQSLSFQASNSAQPGFVQKDGQLVKTVSVSVSSDRILLVVVAIVVIIAILALLYYRLTKGKLPGVGQRRQQSLPQSSQKKITDQKQGQKKDSNTKQ